MSAGLESIDMVELADDFATVAEQWLAGDDDPTKGDDVTIVKEGKCMEQHHQSHTERAYKVPELRFLEKYLHLLRLIRLR